MEKKPVIILDFDGTLYSGEHVFDDFPDYIKKHKREFLPKLSDEQYKQIVEENPDWNNLISVSEIIEYMYIFKKKYRKFKIMIKDFYDWQNKQPDPLVLDDITITSPNFLKSLCKKYSTYVVSNSTPNHILYYMEKFNINPKWFKRIISNRFIARDRSKKHYYEAILKNENCKPQNAYVFGDSLENDIKPAKALGINTNLITKADLLETEISKIIENLK